MELNLNVYKNAQEIEKTYTTDTFKLFFGTIEDFAQLLELDNLKDGSNSEIIKAVAGTVVRSTETVRELLKDVFVGITDAELRRTDINEIATIIVEIVKYTIATIGKNIKTKN